MFKSPLIAAFALLLPLSACAQETTPEPAPVPAAQSLPFSPVVVANNTIFLAGHLGRLPGTTIILTAALVRKRARRLKISGRRWRQ